MSYKFIRSITPWVFTLIVIAALLLIKDIPWYIWLILVILIIIDTFLNVIKQNTTIKLNKQFVKDFLLAVAFLIILFLIFYFVHGK